MNICSKFSRKLTLVLILAAASLSMGASAGVPACSREAADNLVRSFYAPRGHEGGVPSLDELAKSTSPYTHRLHWLLVGAAKYRDDFIRKYAKGFPVPGIATASRKPPFVDGDPFGKGMDGGAPDLPHLELQEIGEGSWEARLQSIPATGSPWKIAVRIAAEDGSCAIDEVVYEDGTLLSTYLAWRGDPTL